MPVIRYVYHDYYVIIYSVIVVAKIFFFLVRNESYVVMRHSCDTCSFSFSFFVFFFYLKKMRFATVRLRMRLWSWWLVHFHILALGCLFCRKYKRKENPAPRVPPRALVSFQVRSDLRSTMPIVTIEQTMYVTRTNSRGIRSTTYCLFHIAKERGKVSQLP